MTTEIDLAQTIARHIVTSRSNGYLRESNGWRVWLVNRLAEGSKMMDVPDTDIRAAARMATEGVESTVIEGDLADDCGARMVITQVSLVANDGGPCWQLRVAIEVDDRHLAIYLGPQGARQLADVAESWSSPHPAGVAVMTEPAVIVAMCMGDLEWSLWDRADGDLADGVNAHIRVLLDDMAGRDHEFKAIAARIAQGDPKLGAGEEVAHAQELQRMGLALVSPSKPYQAAPLPILREMWRRKPWAPAHFLATPPPA